jgi:NCS1 family nucleobase:cation symporter-1
VLIGMLLAVGGAHSAAGQTPFPGEGLIPFLRPLYSYCRVVGLLSASVAYYPLSVLFPARGRGQPARDQRRRGLTGGAEAARADRTLTASGAVGAFGGRPLRA